MKKSIRIVSVFIFLCCCIFAMLFIIPIVSGKKILVGHIEGSQLAYGTIVVLMLLCIILVIIRYRDNRCNKNLMIMIVVSVIATGALLGTSFLYLLFMADSETYYTFYSPDGRYSVVVEEWSWLVGGSVTLYERTSPFLVEFKENMITDDGFRPISADAYEIQWDDNIVTLTIETMDWDRGKDTAVVELRVKK